MENNNNNVFFEIEGIVIHANQNSIFKVKVNNGSIITASISGKIRKNYVKIMIGDRVKVIISQYNLFKGRIIHRF
ncbi:translation initiation factor IF-1 [Candidatus Carsonella ruddii PV]|uniref:Translation initiation factor IF-1 n=1 Tax=Carsonella ruddii (strain PV) TaxID=387662 RepID=Q05FV3_CARRP|nr:translation initiation factor IF-1 [Candidatus Carsonella ruddii]BAF35068.1 translation initiation factor IF-1 [Candidatus Carsonella ruddii PV]